MKEAGMAQRPDPTERAARILTERGPEDRLDAFMMLTATGVSLAHAGTRTGQPRRGFRRGRAPL